ncbi:hypothetical protein CEB3_c29080 [Peptococcaceae bacterium CEB3]|nr:hypothetical protein CEB3_c29080 [Peptococcaceae bacterium CEB3]
MSKNSCKNNANTETPDWGSGNTVENYSGDVPQNSGLRPAEAAGPEPSLDLTRNFPRSDLALAPDQTPPDELASVRP